MTRLPGKHLLTVDVFRAFHTARVVCVDHTKCVDAFPWRDWFEFVAVNDGEPAVSVFPVTIDDNSYDDVKDFMWRIELPEMKHARETEWARYAHDRSWADISAIEDAKRVWRAGFDAAVAHWQGER